MYEEHCAVKQDYKNDPKHDFVLLCYEDCDALSEK